MGFGFDRAEPKDEDEVPLLQKTPYDGRGPFYNHAIMGIRNAPFGGSKSGMYRLTDTNTTRARVIETKFVGTKIENTPTGVAGATLNYTFDVSGFIYGASINMSIEGTANGEFKFGIGAEFVSPIVDTYSIHLTEGEGEFGFFSPSEVVTGTRRIGDLDFGRVTRMGITEFNPSINAVLAENRVYKALPGYSPTVVMSIYNTPYNFSGGDLTDANMTLSIGYIRTRDQYITPTE